MRSSLSSTHDVINVTPFTITFTTAAFDRSSLWLFEEPEDDHLGFLSQFMNFVNPVTGVFTTRKVQLNLDRVVAGVDYHF